MLIRVKIVMALLVLAAYAVVAAGAQDRHTVFESFKRKMMPQVGKIITVSGVLKPGKLGWVVAFQGWEIYIKPTRNSDIPKMNSLNRFEGRTVQVTGTLRYMPAPTPPTESRVAVAIPPEHFYFEMAEAKVTALNPPRPRRRGRVRRVSKLSASPYVL